MSEKWSSDTHIPIRHQRNRRSKIFTPHPSESLNNPLRLKRFLIRQTDGRKQESE
jgi:hypothetical protein